MKIIHRISEVIDAEKRKLLLNIGIEIGLGVQTIKIEEGNPIWPELSSLVQNWQVLDMVDTKFTKRELEDAKNLIMYPKWHWDYPQPLVGYLTESYDLSQYSSSSGVGRIQKASIRIKSEPKWGKRNILQLNWIFDLYFVQPSVWESVFKQFDIKIMPVILHRKKTPAKSVVQLVSQGTVELNIDKYPNEVCQETGIKKYLPISRGFFPSIKRGTDLHFVQSKEYFGSGGQAFHEVIISAALYKELVKHKIRGVGFTPLAH